MMLLYLDNLLKTTRKDSCGSGVELRHNHIQGYNYSKDDKEAYGTYIKANREIPMYIYQNYRYERFTYRKIFPNSNCPKSYQY